jgi:hypothetical protein
MGLIKSYDEFLNENLFGQYSYYGAGSLYPIVNKLAQEGKTPQQIYTYLTTLGIDEERKRSVLGKVFLNESLDFDLFERALFEDEIEDIVKASPDDLAKGIEPSKAKPDEDVKKSLDKLKTAKTEVDKDSEKEKDKEEKPKSSGGDKIAALKSAIEDAEKMEKIRSILTDEE